MTLRGKINRLFIDPGSISSGWALFSGKKLIASGTIAIDKDVAIFKRLCYIGKCYMKQLKKLPRIDEVHIERLVRNTHIYTHYACGVIGAACSDVERVSADLSIKSWQAYCNWGSDVSLTDAYKNKVKSEDELAAIGMGLYYVNKISSNNL